MARSLAAHSRRLAIRDVLEQLRYRVLPLVLAAAIGAMVSAGLLAGGVV